MNADRPASEPGGPSPEVGDGRPPLVTAVVGRRAIQGAFDAIVLLGVGWGVFRLLQQGVRPGHTRLGDVLARARVVWAPPGGRPTPT